MLFSLEQGPYVEKIVEMCARQGKPLPNKIANAPQLLYGLGLYLSAFFRLSSGRNSGYQIGRISWMQIEEYCDRLEIYGSQREIMHFHIGQLDAAFIEYNNSKNKEK